MYSRGMPDRFQKDWSKHNQKILPNVSVKDLKEIYNKELDPRLAKYNPG